MHLGGREVAQHVTPEHELLVQTVRDFARAELLERDREWDRTETSCCTELERLYEMGLMSLRVPEELGGLDCPAVAYARIIRELSYASPSVAVTVAVHSMATEIIREFGREGIRRPMLEQLAAPGNLSAFAISEPNAGSDTAAARTRAEKTAGGWKLYGTKMWVTNGLAGRWFMVLARTGQTGTKADLSLLLLDGRQHGVSRTPIHGKMGIRASETAEMSLDGAFVPEENLLGQEGWGRRIGLSALDGGRIGIAAQAVGIAEACLDLMVAYGQQREQFGQRIADFQAIQWMLADSRTELSAAQALIDRAAWLKDQGRPFTHEASMAKLYASEAAGRIADRAVQVHGGYGYVHEFRVEQLYRDARVTRIYEGTSEIQRRVIARELLKQ
jgi:alkylation response protein AidB-like acyl-CoA dehydrogenase